MAVSVVQTKNASGSGNTQTCAFTPNPTANNGLVVFIGCVDVSATVTAISDTNGNTWVPVTSKTGLGFAAFLYYAKANTTTAADTVSVTVSSSGGFLELLIFEVAPGAGNTQIVVDQSANASVNSNSVSIGPTGTLANASEAVLVYAVLNGSANTVGSGYASANVTSGNLGEYLITTTTAAITATATATGPTGYTGVLGTFQGSTGSLAISPTGIASTTAFGTPTISPINISPAGIASTTVFGTATMGGGVIGTPSVFNIVSTAANNATTYTQGTPGTGNAFKVNLPNASLASNALLLFVANPYSAGRTITIADNKANSWGSALGTYNDGTNMISAYAVYGAITGTQNLTVTFDVALNACTFWACEINNLASSAQLDVHAGQAVASSNTVATGSMTTTAAGDLVIQFGWDSSNTGLTSNLVTGFTKMSGFTNLTSDIMLGKFVQYEVQSSAGAINPTMTVTTSSGTNSWLTMALAFKGGSTGTAPATNVSRIYSVHHVNYFGRNVNYQFAAFGNLLVLDTAFGYLLYGITDSRNNLWQQAKAAYISANSSLTPLIWFAPNASVSDSMSFFYPVPTGTLTQAQVSFLLYDVLYAAANQSPPDQETTAFATSQANGSFTLGSINPSASGELCLGVNAVGLGAITASGAGQVYDTVTYTGVGAADLMDNADGYSHFISSGPGAVNLGWTLPSGGPTQMQIGGVAFRGFGQSGGVGISLAQPPVMAQYSSGSTISATFTSNTTTGNTIVVLAEGYAGATVRTITGISGASFGAAIVTNPGSASNYAVAAGYAAANITGGTTPTITVTFSGTLTFGAITIFELAGMPATVTLDGTAGTTNGTSQFPATAALSTTGNNDILFAILSASNPTQSGTWTTMVDSQARSAFMYTFASAALTSFSGYTNLGSSHTYGTIVFALAGAPTGSQNISPTGIASTTAFGTAVLAAGAVNISPSGIASGSAFGTAVLTPGAVNISPSGIASTSAFGTATVVSGFLISPSGIASTTAFGTPVLATGAANISPSGIASTTAFGTPAISAGSINISVIGIPSNNRFGNPIVLGNVILPAGIASVTAFGAPTFSMGPVNIAVGGLGSVTAFGRPQVVGGYPELTSPVPPYSGQDQQSAIAVTADIAWRESQREEGPWVMPPYQTIFPPSTPAPSVDVIPPPIRATDLWNAMQEFPL